MGLFDAQKLGTPAVSFKGARKGVTVSGVILPQQQRNADGSVDLVAYFEYPATDDNGDPKLYKDGNPIMEGKFLLQTDLKKWDLASTTFIDRAENEFPDEQDGGLRQWYVGSKYARDAVKAAYKDLRVPPEIGGRMTIVVQGVGKGTAGNGEAYTYPDIKVHWTPADAEGKRIADAHAATLPTPVQPVAAGSVFADDEPPF